MPPFTPSLSFSFLPPSPAPPPPSLSLSFTRTVDTASLEYEAVPEALQPPLQLRLPQHMLGDKGLCSYLSLKTTAVPAVLSLSEYRVWEFYNRFE